MKNYPKKIFVNVGVFFQFVSLSIIIESLLWTLVVNNMTPDQIMNDTFGNDLLPSHIPKLIHHSFQVPLWSTGTTTLDP